MSIYYHLTTEDNAKKILKEGLKPMIGDNSSLVEESKPAIYLSDFESIIYWKIILDRNVILQVDCDIEPKKCNYSLYNEYILHREIPAEKIQISTFCESNSEYKSCMKKLCNDYLWIFSEFCSDCAYYYSGMQAVKREEFFKELLISSKSIVNTMYNLNYNYTDKKSIINEIKMQVEGIGYTSCDIYFNTGKRLYEMLIEYPEDDLSENRKKIYDYIYKNLDGCLDIDTGGFC